jgi:hypothetical protein
VSKVRFFTRLGCSLRLDALGVVERELARRLGPPRVAFAPDASGPTPVVRRVEYRDGSVLQVVVVDVEPALRKDYGFRVPVIELEGGPTLHFDFHPRAFIEAMDSVGGAPAR